MNHMNVTQADLKDAITDLIAQVRAYINSREAGLFPDFPVRTVKSPASDTELYRYDSIKSAVVRLDFVKSKL